MSCFTPSTTYGLVYWLAPIWSRMSLEKLRLLRVTKLSSWSSKPMPKIHSTVIARTLRERKERMPALALF